MAAGPKNALAAWGRSALRPVVLPSGTRALVKLPGVSDLVKNEALPQELRALAARFGSGGIEVTKLSEEEIPHFVRLTYELIARAVKYLALPESEAWDLFLRQGGDPASEGWEAVTLDASFFAGEDDVDQADVEALGALVGRQKTPNEVTLASCLDRGEPLPGGRQIDPDEGGRVTDFAGFRDGAGGDRGRADGEGVGASPIRVPRGERPGHRLRRR
jgi:hypothetical protein